MNFCQQSSIFWTFHVLQFIFLEGIWPARKWPPPYWGYSSQWTGPEFPLGVDQSVSQSVRGFEISLTKPREFIEEAEPPAPDGETDGVSSQSEGDLENILLEIFLKIFKLMTWALYGRSLLHTSGGRGLSISSITRRDFVMNLGGNGFLEKLSKMKIPKSKEKNNSWFIQRSGTRTNMRTFATYMIYKI